MNEIIKKLKNKNFSEILLIIIIILICAKIYDFHIFNILSDRGRELFIPEAILDGKVPYRDILMLYFPLGYYLNALFMLVGKISLNTMFWVGIVNCVLFAVMFFELSKEFISKKISLIFTITTICMCMFNYSLFSYIFPYSYSMVYGLTAYLASTLLLIKYVKSHNEKLLYFAGLFSGLSFAFKAEFFLMTIIFLTVLFWKNTLHIKTKIISIINLLIFPIMTLLIPIIQGAKISDITNYFSFITNFSHTKSMIFFYQSIGTIFAEGNIPAYISGIIGIVLFITMAILSEKLYQKTHNKIILILLYIITSIVLYIITDPINYMILSPLILLVIFTVKYSNIKKDKAKMILLIATLCLCTRSFAMLLLYRYGNFYFPFLILSIFVLTKDYEFKNSFLKEIKVENIFIYMSIFFIAYAEITAFSTLKYCKEKIETEKGYIYLFENQGKYIHNTIDFLKKNTKNSDKILILPEGHIINFLANRKTDTRLHMLDRLYYDGLGSEKAKKLLEETNNDYIIIVQGFLLSDFGEKFLYGEKNNITDYIKNNYKVIKFFGDKSDNVTILKKN